MRKHQRTSGFTLVELAIVVVIVGILGVIGFAIYRRHRATVRTTEATQVTAGIRVAQEAVITERGTYASVSNDSTSYYPAATPGPFVTEWGGKCTNCAGGDVDGWNKLAFHPSGPVMFGYATVAGIGGDSLAVNKPSAANDVDTKSASLKATDPFYITVAWGDTDGDGVPCVVLSYSTSNQIIVKSAGE